MITALGHGYRVLIRQDRADSGATDPEAPFRGPRSA